MSKTATKTRRAVEPVKPEGGALAPIDTAPSSYKVKKKVTIPTLKFPPGSRICFKITTPIKEGRALKESRAGNPTNKMGPAQVMEIMSPEGELRQLVVATVFRSELDDNYPDEGYVGKWFVVKKLPIAEGKRYSTFEIDEIEDPT